MFRNRKYRDLGYFTIPENTYEVRSFHGLASFYRKIIKNFSQICAPLIDTFIGSRKPFKWTEAADRNFKLLKKKDK